MLLVQNCQTIARIFQYKLEGRLHTERIKAIAVAVIILGKEAERIDRFAVSVDVVLPETRDAVKRAMDIALEKMIEKILDL